MKHAFAGVVKAILLAALLALTALLAGAFESRSMPVLLIWHATTRTLAVMPEYNWNIIRSETMKLIRHVIALAAVVTSIQTLAAMPEKHDVTTTGDLIELCSVSADDPLYEAAMGFCLGYIDAAMDYHAALTAGPKFDPIVCPYTTVTREEVVVVVLEWSKGNTQLLESEAPVQGVMRAIYEKWPCSN